MLISTWEMTQVRVVTDSCACLPQELIEKYKIVVVPTIVILGDQEYRDGIDITPGQLYEIQRQRKILPTTSAPSPVAFLEVYRQLSRETSNILQLTLSPNLSMIYNSALQAREMAKESLPGVKIEIIDTQTGAGGQGLIVLEAGRAAAAGATMPQVIERVRALIPRVQLLAILDTLYFLAKGGRVPKVAAWAGSLLSIKPILQLVAGEVELLEKIRTRSRAVRRMLQLLRERVGKNRIHVMLMHADAREELEELGKEVSAEFNCAELYLSDMTPVLGAHTGPGLLGMAFYVEE